MPVRITILSLIPKAQAFYRVLIHFYQSMLQLWVARRFGVPYAAVLCRAVKSTRLAAYIKPIVI